MKALLLLLFFSLSTEAKNIVVWLSMDGFSPSYLEHAPTLRDLMSKGLSSRHLQPIFPSITFPSHSSEATGVLVEEHGISSNKFYDSKTKEFLVYPNDAFVLTAEPIWQTVKRGKLKSSVQDWPLSFNQTGPFKADFFGKNFIKDLSDEERVNRFLAHWQNNQDLDLLMLYVVGPDAVGHKFGPNSDEVKTKVAADDKLVAKLKSRIIEFQKSHPADKVYFLVTTDHGMIPVHTAVNFELLADLKKNDKVRFYQGGPVGHLFFDRYTGKDKREAEEEMIRLLRKQSFLKVYRRAEMPKKWGYTHPSRVGDLVVLLDEGHAFVEGSARPVMSVEETQGPRGMHGYDPEIVKGMEGLFVLWRSPEYQSPKELPHVMSLELHALVAKILGIAPSRRARKTKLEF